MKKILVSLIFSVIALTAFATNTVSIDTLALPRSGAVYIYANNPSALYLIKGNDSLTGNVSYMFSGTPLTGSQITLWFNNTTVSGIDRKVYILGVDYTTYLMGNTNLFVTCTYNGSAWTVSSVPATVVSYLSDYVTQEQFSDALAGLVDTGSLTARLSNYALLSGASFASLQAPIQSNSDSSTNVETTAGAKRLIQASVAGLASVSYVNSSISSSIASATATITASYLSAISGSIQTFQVNPAIDSPWAAGTYNLNTLATGVSNTIQPPAINGNIVLACPSPPAGVSEITLILPFTGSFTVTAGTGVVITATHTGAATHVSVLALVWSKAANAYVEKSFMQN